MLEVTGLEVAYGGIKAVKGIDLEVNKGELVALIGANGAGKTTTLKAVTGTQPVAAGNIEFLGRSIKGQGAWDLVKQGLVMVPEGRGTFTRMTIVENLQMGAFTRRDSAESGLDSRGVRVVAWALLPSANGGQWTRWQSGPLLQRDDAVGFIGPGGLNELHMAGQRRRQRQLQIQQVVGIG